MKSIKRPIGYVPVRSLVMRALAGTGVISVSLLAPKMTRLLKELDRPAKNRMQLYQRIDQAVLRLSQKGLVAVTGERGSRRVTLTERGKDLARKMEFETYKIPEKAFWDGKWRVLIFDLPEQRRRTRDQLRRILMNAGFIRLQDSVWVFPYPCDDFVVLVRAHLKSGVGEVRSFVAEALESDKTLREHFRLV